MKVFLDSSFIIALILENDDLHQKAILLKEKGILSDKCYISNLIINEVVTVIGNKTNKEIAKYSYYFLKDNCILINETEISYINDRTMDTYLEHNTKLSFADCSIVEVMKESSINKLVSFDKYFDRVDKIERIH